MPSGVAARPPCEHLTHLSHCPTYPSPCSSHILHLAPHLPKPFRTPSPIPFTLPHEHARTQANAQPHFWLISLCPARVSNRTCCNSGVLSHHRRRWPLIFLASVYKPCRVSLYLPYSQIGEASVHKPGRVSLCPSCTDRGVGWGSPSAAVASAQACRMCAFHGEPSSCVGCSMTRVLEKSTTPGLSSAAQG